MDITLLLLNKIPVGHVFMEPLNQALYYETF